MALSEAVSRQVWRIVDANLNRIGEGLRLLEDMARLLLNDAALTQQLKAMRHELIESDLSFNRELLQARDAEGDVGAYIDLPTQEKQRELPLTLVANSRRVQESLRVIEELAKAPGLAARLDSEKFKQARFNLYTLEQRLLFRFQRQDKLKHLRGLYVVIDTQVLRGRSHLEVAAQAIRGGAGIIQLRDKISNKKQVLSVAQQLKDLCCEHNVLFIMNDYLDIAMATDADGLHVGQEDLPVKVARKLLPLDKILGCSTTTVEEATIAESEGADYIAVGSIYPTSSKDIIVVGLERLRQTRQAVALPLVAIGGINQDNVSHVIAAGADSVAVISAVVAAESPEEAVREIASKFEV